MGLTYRCMTIAASIIIFGICIAEIVVTSKSNDTNWSNNIELFRLLSVIVVLLAVNFLMIGAIVKKRVLLWIGIPLIIVAFVTLSTLDIILLIKYLNLITHQEEAFGVLNILLFLIIFPFLICVSWSYAKELRTTRRDNRCLDFLGW